MDELELLRRLEADVPRGSHEVMAAAFEVLEARMTAAELADIRRRTPRLRRRLRRVRWTVVASVAVVVTVLALVLTDAVGISPLQPDARADAAELLERAASDTVRTADPIVRAGQYRQVEFQSVHEIEAGGPSTLLWIHEDRTDWIPADATDTWTEVRYPATPTDDVRGPGAAAALAAARQQAAAGVPEVLHGAGGAFFGAPDSTSSPAAIAALPHDPRELLAWIRRDVGETGWSSDEASFERIAELLSSGVAPAPLRAALYRAAALIPTVKTVPHAATLRGLDGIAIGRVEPGNGIRLDLVIDPDTGELIGERKVTTRPIDDLPAGTTLSWSSTTTTVVDQVPAEYRP